MPTFVTGGTGLVGVNLIRALLARGESVRALVRQTSPRTGWDAAAVDCVTGDVTDIDSVRKAMAGCDRVYHLAGWVQITPWGIDQARRVNVSGTENVCRVALERKVDRVVHVSSIATIAQGSLGALATEDSPCNASRRLTPYHTTKFEAEQVVRRFIDRGLDAVIVNPAYVVGPFDIKPTSGRIIHRIATRRLLGYPARGGICFVDAREVADGLMRAMARGRCGERYLLGNENISYRDYAHRVASVAGVDPPRFALSYGLLYPAALVADTLGRFRPDLFRDFNLAVLRAGFCEHYVSAEKSRRELDVESRPIDQAITDALAWFEQTGYLIRTENGWRSGRRSSGRSQSKSDPRCRTSQSLVT